MSLGSSAKSSRLRRKEWIHLTPIEHRTLARKAPGRLSTGTATTSEPQKTGLPSLGRRAGSFLGRHGAKFVGRWQARVLAACAVPVFVLLAGCGGSTSGGTSSNGTLSVSPGTATVDTNCTGCNGITNSGQTIEQFSATLSGGGTATVTWAVSGGDANAGAGSISTSGQYIPPPYLTADSVKVTVTATIASGTGMGTSASASVAITPGFLEPLSPENAALGANGSLTVNRLHCRSRRLNRDQLCRFKHGDGIERRPRRAGVDELLAQRNRVHSLFGHLQRSGIRHVHGFCIRGWHRRLIVFKDCGSSPVEHGGNLEQSCDAPGATGVADPDGQFRWQQ